MKKSLYNKVMFVVAITCLLLLIAIAFKTGVFADFNTSNVFGAILSLLTNSFVSSTLCSILAVVIIYITQVKYSKSMIKKDFRCNEIIQDIYEGIEAYCQIADEVPIKASGESECDILKNKKKDSTRFYNFFKNNKGEIDIITLSLSCRNNDILIESLQSCFFINLNFKLLNIVNNIKNRLPNVRNKYHEIEEIYEECELEGKDDKRIALDHNLSTYFIDLRFLALYWKALLDYLAYDPTYIKIFIELYNSNYVFEEDINQSVEVRNFRAKEIDKKVRKTMRQHNIKNFWNKS